MKSLVSSVLLGLVFFLPSPVTAAAVVSFDQCLPESAIGPVGDIPSMVSSSWCGSSLSSMRITLAGSALDVEVDGGGEAVHTLVFNVGGSLDGLTISNLSSGYSINRTDATTVFGAFDFEITDPDNTIGATQQLAFTLMRDGGFLSPLELFAVNEYGFTAGLRLVNSFGVSTFALGSEIEQLSAVPEPSSMLLLATGLAAAWRARRS